MAYTDKLVHLLEAHADPVNAAPMKKYMRDQFDFLGIKAPIRRELWRRFMKEEGLPEVDNIPNVVRALWHQPFREFQYCGLDLLIRMKRHLTGDDVKLCQWLITTKSWWDTVDGIASSVVGHILRKYPDQRDVWITAWQNADDMWLRRTSIIFQLKYGDDTDWELLAELCRHNADSREFFIQKAIGWSLRQYSKYQPRIVADFVVAHELPALSAREAMKHISSSS